MDKRQIISSYLDTFFKDPPIPLQHTDAFTLLVAVILSASTQDARVNMVTPLLFKKAPNPERMAVMPQDELEAILKPIGLFRAKAGYLKKMAQELVDRFEGKVPSSLEELESLSGVGHKTASVVMCQVFQKPAFPVDTHIYRLAHRWGIATHASYAKTEEKLKAFFPQEEWALRHLQMILYGRQFCPARGHILEECPICLKLSPSA